MMEPADLGVVLENYMITNSREYYVLALASSRVSGPCTQTLNVLLQLILADECWLEVLRRQCELNYQLVFTYSISHPLTYRVLVQEAARVNNASLLECLQENIETMIDAFECVDPRVRWETYQEYLKAWEYLHSGRQLIPIQRAEGRLRLISKVSPYEALRCQNPTQFFAVVGQLARLYFKIQTKKVKSLSYWTFKKQYSQLYLLFDQTLSMAVGSLTVKGEPISSAVNACTSIMRLIGMYEAKRQVIPSLTSFIVSTPLIKLTIHRSAEDIHYEQLGLVYREPSDSYSGELSSLIVAMAQNCEGFLMNFLQQSKRDTFASPDVLLKIGILWAKLLERPDLVEGYLLAWLRQYIEQPCDGNPQLYRILRLNWLLSPKLPLQHLVWTIKCSLFEMSSSEHRLDSLSNGQNSGMGRADHLNRELLELQSGNILRELSRCHGNKSKLVRSPAQEEIVREYTVEVAEHVSLYLTETNNITTYQLMRDMLNASPLLAHRNGIQLIKIFNACLMKLALGVTVSHNNTAGSNERTIIGDTEVSPQNRLTLIYLCIECIQSCIENMPVEQALQSQFVMDTMGRLIVDHGQSQHEYTEELYRLIAAYLVRTKTMTPIICQCVLRIGVYLGRCDYNLAYVATVLQALADPTLADDVMYSYGQLIKYLVDCIRNSLSQRSERGLSYIHLYETEWSQQCQTVVKFLQAYQTIVSQEVELEGLINHNMNSHISHRFPLIDMLYQSLLLWPNHQSIIQLMLILHHIQPSYQWPNIYQFIRVLGIQVAIEMGMSDNNTNHTNKNIKLNINSYTYKLIMLMFSDKCQLANTNNVNTVLDCWVNFKRSISQNSIMNDSTNNIAAKNVISTKIDSIDIKQHISHTLRHLRSIGIIDMFEWKENHTILLM